MSTSTKRENRTRRHRRIRMCLFGTARRPRVSVYRSDRFVEVQLVDDEKNKTVLSVHGKKEKAKNKTEQAAMAGKTLAKLAQKAGIKTMIFDRSGYRYHGRVKAVVEALRSEGIEV